MTLLNASLGGMFAFAAVHYALQWWLSRHEKVLLWVALLCAIYTVFAWTSVSSLRATTIEDAQTFLTRGVTVGLLGHVVTVQFYASLAGRRDRVFRGLVMGAFVALVVVNQWVPVRGTIVELRAMSLPGAGTGSLAIRTPPGLLLAVLYAAVVAAQGYGLFIAQRLRTRDRWATVLLAFGVVAILFTSTVGILVDFAGVRAPYVGSSAIAVLLLCSALLLSREYAARGAREAAMQRRFESAFEHAPIGKALLAPDGRFLKVNSALCRMVKASEAELGTRRLEDLADRDDPIADAAICRRLLAGELAAHTVEKRIWRTDGTPVWAHLVVSAIPDEHADPVRLIVQVQDVSELRAHRERLEELVATRTRELHAAKDEADRANDAKSRFVAHLSHEIRNTVGVILLYTQILQLDRVAGEEVEIIDSSGKHLLALLNQSLELSRAEAGHVELGNEPFDMAVTLDDVQRMFAAQAAAKGIELAVQHDREVLELMGDGTKVKQILINVTANALKFTQRGSVRLTSSARAVDDGAIRVTVVIADTGSGIEPANLARIFERFGSVSSGSQGGGAGLGLAISLAYARSMGGDVTAESTPGVGTTFTFTFVATPAVPGAPTASVVRLGPPRRVLVVDDEAANRNALAQLLGAHRFEIRTAADGKAALVAHAEWLPDLVLIDLRMPEMDGIEAIRGMRSARSNAAIGMLSASALAEDEQTALAVGADFFLQKPYDHRALLDRVVKALAERDAVVKVA
jgi:PAS domain S-box-containing protein